MATEEEVKQSLKRVGRLVSEMLPPGIGFGLFVYEQQEDGWLTYMSNSNREDFVRVLKDFIQRQGG